MNKFICFYNVCLTLSVILGPYQAVATLENFFRLAGLAPLSPPFSNTDIFRLMNTAERNFTYSPWSEFSECDKVCGGGQAFRSRSCLDEDGTRVSITNCDRTRNSNPLEVLQNFLRGNNLLTEVERISCRIRPCDTSAWSEWSLCSLPCGGGVQTSTRLCADSTDTSRCNVQLVRSRSCGVQRCFRVTEWEEWGRCSHQCDGGEQSRTRRCIPNVDRNHPSYTQIREVITNLQSYSSFRLNLWPASPGSTITQVFTAEYRRSCGVPMESRQRCNLQQCPDCPQNQVYFHCLRCQRRCERLEGARYFQLEGFNNLLLNSLLCNEPGGNCNAGCGCPVIAPYLGSDQRCYTIQQSCPINRVNRGTNPTQPTALGRNFLSTAGPAQVSRHSTFVPTTHNTTTTLIRTISPSGRSSNNTNISGESSNSSVELVPCDRNIFIATTPNYVPCVCSGTLIEIDCFHDETTSCPVMCTQNYE